MHLLLSIVVAIAAATGRPQGEAEIAAWIEAFRKGDVSVMPQLVAAGKPAIAPLVAVMRDTELKAITRFMAANVLGDIGEKECVEPLLEALADPYYNHRRCAAIALGKCKDERARTPLLKLAAEDPFVFTDPKTGERLHLVRDSALEGLALLDGRDPNAVGLAKEAEIFLDDASKLPPSPVTRSLPRVPWPFPGGFEDQNVFNNYEQPTDDYVHGGLDLMHDAGTEVRAVADGWVALIDTNYKDWKTHHVVAVSEVEGGREGWTYTHMDPDTFAFRVGDRIRKGQVLAKLVDFKVGKNEGADHLHLAYERFEKLADGTLELTPLFDPLQCLDVGDQVAPTVHAVLFLYGGTTKEIPKDAKGAVFVSGRVDVLALVSDAGRADQGCSWGVPVVTIEIRGPRGKEGDAAAWRKLVLDLRGELGEKRAAPAVFLSYATKQPFLAGLPPYPVVQAVVATHTDGDGRIERADAVQCWDTSETTADGKRRFPDGTYDVTVRAWDLAGRQGTCTATAVVSTR